jgi:hypothetical protein
MSTRRVDEDDDVDIEVELNSNDSNMGVDVLGATPSHPSHNASAAPIQSTSAMEIDQSTITASSDTIQAREQTKEGSNMDTTQMGVDQPATKAKTELDLELESKYSKIWGELKVRFINRHFLKSATSYLQSVQNTAGTDASDEVTVGTTTFYTSDTPILDIYLGMENR